jgi:hypothetical protein
VPARLVVGISGATGAVYGLRLLDRAHELGIETHLVATPAGLLNVHHELGLDRKSLEAHAGTTMSTVAWSKLCHYCDCTGDGDLAYESFLFRISDVRPPPRPPVRATGPA